MTENIKYEALNQKMTIYFFIYSLSVSKRDVLSGKVL